MKQILAALAVLSLCLALFAIPTGCETESVDKRVRVVPDSVTIRRGQSIEFTATGGFDYDWDLSNESRGTLSARTGARTVYTSLFSPDSNDTDVVQVLSVVSSIEGAGGTNQSPATWRAEAIIHHL